MGTKARPGAESLSFIIPARNEAEGLASLLPKLREQYPDAEIIAVNDASTDDTEAVCGGHGVEVHSHPYPMGNGASIKTGVRAARGETLVLLDGDGQHDPEDVPRLLEKFDDGFDMVVGARDAGSQANFGRLAANTLYNHLSSWMVRQKIEDLTSGFRVVKASKIREFLHLFPNGFSYPTTVTMSFFRAGYAVGYVPIRARKASGASHIQPLRDGARFLLIIFRVGTLYSPLKLFVPISLVFFALGIGYYGYTYFAFGRFTNMSALLLSTSVIVFSIGLVSEQISNLLFSRRSE